MAHTFCQPLDAIIETARSRGVGSSRHVCPSCGRGPRDQTLGITVEPDGGALHNCFRCGASGYCRANHRAPIPKPRRQREVQGQTPIDVDTAIDKVLAACHPIAGEGPGRRYLTARQCPLPQNDVLEHPHLLHWISRNYHPALVSIVTDVVTGARKTLHFTYLTPRGEKAPVKPTRLQMKGGHKQGGVIRLVPDAEVTLGLGIAEGLETALSAMAAGFSPVWSCIDAGNLAAFPVLSGIEALSVYVDNDKAGLDAFQQVARRWRLAGREVLHFIPTKGDLNDWLQGWAT